LFIATLEYCATIAAVIQKSQEAPLLHCLGPSQASIAVVASAKHIFKHATRKHLSAKKASFASLRLSPFAVNSAIAQKLQAPDF